MADLNSLLSPVTSPGISTLALDAMLRGDFSAVTPGGGNTGSVAMAQPPAAAPAPVPPAPVPAVAAPQQAAPGGRLHSLLSGVGMAAHVIDNVLGLGIGNAINTVQQDRTNDRLRQTLLPLLANQSVPQDQRIAQARAMLNQEAAQGTDVSKWQSALQAAEDRSKIVAYANTIKDPNLRQVFLQDPKAYLDAVAEGMKPQVIGEGSSIYQNGGFTPAPITKPIEIKQGVSYILPDGKPGQNPADVPPPPAPSATDATASKTPSADDVWQAVIQQESHGQPGITGPQTPYGRAQGETQLLPATAQAMAQKLNIAWRPDLMTGTSPEAAAYQQQLGRAYFDEGLQNSGGNIRQALMYYYGGPNQRLWGPKTHAYADQVLARVTPYQVASNGPTPPPPSGATASAGAAPVSQEVAQAQPQAFDGWHVVAQGQPATPHAPPGYRWSADGRSMEPIPGGPADPLPNTQGSNLTGDPYLQTLPGARAQQVKALAEGRMAFPSGFALKSPYWQQLLQDVSQYDPSFDAVNYGARAKTRADFTSGKSAQNINAINTAIGHLSMLAQYGDQLNNTGMPALNAVKNWAEVQMGDKRVGQYQQLRDGVAGELTRVYRGTGGSEADVKQWQSNFPVNGSPDQIRGAIQAAANMLQSRLDSLGMLYNQGMGTTKDPLELLNSHTATMLQQFEKAGSLNQTSGQPQGGGQLPRLTPQQAAQLPSGTHFVGMDGKERVRK